MLAAIFASLFFYTSTGEFINLDLIEKIAVIKTTNKIQIGMRINDHTYWHVVHSNEELRCFIEHNFEFANIPEFIIEEHIEAQFEDLGD